MHLTEDFPVSSRLIRKTFRDEQKMNPNSARNIWKLLARTPPEPDSKNPTRFQLCSVLAFFVLWVIVNFTFCLSCTYVEWMAIKDKKKFSERNCIAVFLFIHLSGQ